MRSDRAASPHLLSPSGLVLIGITLLLWGSSFPAIRRALPDYPPLGIAGLRLLVAAILLGILTIWRPIRGLTRRDYGMAALAGLFGFSLCQALLSYGETRVVSGTASLMLASAPIFTGVVSSFLFGEKVRLAGWLGLVVSLVGVAVVSWDASGGFALNAAALALLVAAFGQGVYFSLIRPVAERCGAVAATTIATWAGAAALLPFAVMSMGRIPSASLPASLSILFLGIFPGAIGYVVWSEALRRAPAAIAGSFLFLVPLVAALVGWAWLGEKLGLGALVGGLLIIAGVAVVNWSRRRAATAPLAQSALVAEAK